MNKIEPEYLIEVNGITKTYTSSFGRKKVTALDNLTINVEKGSIFGLLGQNGAGKTTLIKLLLGIAKPTIGEAKMFGTDVSDYKVRRRIGFLPENHRFPPFLTGGEVLYYFGKMQGIESKELKRKRDYLLDMVKMTQWSKVKMGAYSKGMIQRIGIALALMGEPELIFLDEPTDGVDPIGRKEIRELLLDLKKQGITIFLNSHLLSEVELITDRVAILNKGKLVTEGTVEELTSNKQEYNISIEGSLEAIPESDLLTIYNIKNLKSGNFAVNVADVNELNKLIDLLRSLQINITSVAPNKKTLEDTFISLIQGGKK